MKLYIDTNPQVTKTIAKQQTFFATPVDLPKELGEQLLAFEQRVKTYRAYLNKLEQHAKTRAHNLNFNDVEAPEWVETVEVVSEEKPKPQDTEAPSSSESQEKPSDKGLESVMSRKEKTYTPDFILPNGVIVECKGRLTVHDRTKHKRIKEQHPNLDIRFVFQYNNPITKGSKTRYTDWAEKNGFMWAMLTIPPEWAKEKK
jgi:hypothetical protein